MSTPEPAPYLDDIAQGRPLADARWLRTSDGVRIRMAVWRPDVTPSGTIVMLPGRTEHIEKYHDLARDFTNRGFVMLAIDWRGQGLADRVHPDAALGHVEQITDYQLDLAAVLKAAEAMDLPRPWHLLGHSMGGGIGLRAVMEGVPVASCAFTGPMWGIHFSPMLRPVSRLIPSTLDKVGLGGRLPPSAKRANYVLTNGFADNTLTKDPEQFAQMHRHLSTHPQLAIGGPTNRWLIEALREVDHLATRPSPDMPCLCILGGDEAIIDTPSVHDRMARWPNGRLEVIDAAEHEVLMEVPSSRTRVLDMLTEHFHATS